jgi:glycosyltransferase involved in cell wall biosynthesis
VRLAVYTDYAYRKDSEGTVYGERSFVLFLSALGKHVDRLVIVGRLNPTPGRSHYEVTDADFVPLPYHSTLTRPHEAIWSLIGSLRRFWRVLDDVDAVWLMGPYIHSIAFVALAAIRRRRITLGVRQDLPALTRTRHPERRWLQWAADGLEAIWHTLARRFPIVVVGPELARHYDHARATLPIAVSLVSERDIASPELARERSYNGELTAISVGRIEREKNPLLLAEVLALLRGRGKPWRMRVCGEGPMLDQLAERLRELGVAEHAELLGYVPIEGGLLDLYRSSHAFLHVSFSEGLPQVLFEAFAAALPVVATSVGGVPDAVGDAGILIEPADAEAAAAALERLADDEQLRAQLVSAGIDRVRRQTLEHESSRVAAFVTGERPRAPS